MRATQTGFGTALNAGLHIPLKALPPGTGIILQRGKRRLSAESRKPLADFGGDFHRRSRNKASVGADNVKCHPFISIAQPLQHGIPGGARRLPQLVLKDAGDDFHAAGDLAREQGIESRAELKAEESVQHNSQQEQVQKEPEQDLGVEWKAELHRVEPQKGTKK